MPPSSWPRDYRVTAVIVTAALLALGWAETRVRSVARAQALEIVSADRETFKRDALDAAQRAAREGAEVAVREAVVPVLVEVRTHRAQDEQAQRDTDRRLDAIERRDR